MMGPAGFWKLLGFVLTLFGPIARLILDTIEFITGFEWLTSVLDVVLLLIAAGQVWLKWKRKISLSNPIQHNQDAKEGHIAFLELMEFLLMLVVPIARLILDTSGFITGFEWLTIVVDVVSLLIASGQVRRKWKRKISLPKPNQHKQDTEEGHLDLSNLDAFHHNDRKSLGECWYMKLQFTMKHTLK